MTDRGLPVFRIQIEEDIVVPGHFRYLDNQTIKHYFPSCWLTATTAKDNGRNNYGGHDNYDGYKNHDGYNNDDGYKSNNSHDSFNN